MKKARWLPLMLIVAMFLTGCSQKAVAPKEDTNPKEELTSVEAKDQKEDAQESIEIQKIETEKETETETETKTETKEEIQKELRIPNMDGESVFSKVPEKIFCNEINLTEILLELGLKDKIVAIAGDEFNQEDALPEHLDDMKSLKYAGDFLSLEAVIATGCDFIYSNPTSYSETYTLADFNEKNIDVYACRSNYVQGATIEDVYTDIENLGKIFHIEDTAKELIEKLRTRQKEVEAKRDETKKPVDVFVFDFGDAEVLTAGAGLVSDIIKSAGGHNVFEDVEKPWAMVSWEEIVARNPQVILVHVYPRNDATFEEKVQQLKENPILKDLDAVKNDRFVKVPLIENFAGIQMFNGMKRIQEGLKDCAD